MRIQVELSEDIVKILDEKASVVTSNRSSLSGLILKTFVEAVKDENTLAGIMDYVLRK